jgi:3-hydroxyacyl-[acyl-carrier-protein] dehydratase
MKSQLKNIIVDFSEFDVERPIADRQEVLKLNPHRFEMQLLDGVLFYDGERAVGYRDSKPDEFWVRGHFPSVPLMPGVLICECAAQLTSFYAVKAKLVDSGYVGLGGLDNVRFRGPVVPGDQLIVMLRAGRIRRNVMFSADFQVWVNQQLVADGVIKGVALGDNPLGV